MFTLDGPSDERANRRGTSVHCPAPAFACIALEYVKTGFAGYGFAGGGVSVAALLFAWLLFPQPVDEQAAAEPAE